MGRRTSEDAEEVAEVMRNIGNVLDYIHQQQVIHRDIKPSNIPNHTQRRLRENHRLPDWRMPTIYAILKQPAGTQRYIAPEQLESNVQLDGRADIYSFGVMLADINKSLRHPSRHLRNIAKKCSQPDRERRYSALSETVGAADMDMYGRQLPRRCFCLYFYSWHIGWAVSDIHRIKARQNPAWKTDERIRSSAIHASKRQQEYRHNETSRCKHDGSKHHRKQ